MDNITAAKTIYVQIAKEPYSLTDYLLLGVVMLVAGVILYVIFSRLIKDDDR